MELNDIRSGLNDIDESIAKLLEQRYELIEQVAESKRLSGKKIFDEARENAVVEHVTGVINNPCYKPYAAETYRELMRISRSFQEKYLANIVLIGMPGCGKSTIGKKLAEQEGYSFIDCDELFEELYHMTCTECITKCGEAVFRDYESRALDTIKDIRRTVIAAGGGVVELSSNREKLGSMGTIIYIKRELDSLAKDGRPLTAAFGVEELYRRRHEKYEQWADASVINDDPESAVCRISELIDIKGK